MALLAHVAQNSSVLIATSIPRLLLETSEALAYVNVEPGAPPVEQLLEYAEAKCIRIDMARAGWDELQEREGVERERRIDRLRRCVRLVGNVIRPDEWILGVDTLGSKVTPFVELTLPVAASRPDRDQFLVHESGGYDFFVTSDPDLCGHQARTRVSEPLALRVGRAADALVYLQELWAEQAFVREIPDPPG